MVISFDKPWNMWLERRCQESVQHGLLIDWTAHALLRCDQNSALKCHTRSFLTSGHAFLSTNFNIFGIVVGPGEVIDGRDPNPEALLGSSNQIGDGMWVSRAWIWIKVYTTNSVMAQSAPCWALWGARKLQNRWCPSHMALLWTSSFWFSGIPILAKFWCTEVQRHSSSMSVSRLVCLLIRAAWDSCVQVLSVNMDGNGTSSLVSSITQQYSNVTIMSTVIEAILTIALYSMASKIGNLAEDEPPILNSNIALIGHLVGMLTRQVGYFQMLRYCILSHCYNTIWLHLSARLPSHPAFTLKIFSNRIYVICDPSLIQAAYKNTKAFDFGQFVIESSQRAFEIGEQGMRIICGETAPGYDPKGAFLNGNNGDSFLNENHKLSVEALTPGAGLSTWIDMWWRELQNFLMGLMTMGRVLGFTDGLEMRWLLLRLTHCMEPRVL